MPVSVKILGVLSDFKRTLPKCLQIGEIIFFNGIKHRRKIVLAPRRSYLRSTAFLGRGGIIILLTPLNAAESVLRWNTGHCRGCFVECLQTGEIIFFFGIKHTRKIVLALRRSYERFTGVLEWGGIIILLSRLNAAESVLRGHTGHCRGCFVKCLQTSEIIFFFGMKRTLLNELYGWQIP